MCEIDVLSGLIVWKKQARDELEAWTRLFVDPSNKLQAHPSHIAH